MNNTFTAKQHVIFDIEIFKCYWLVVALVKESKQFYFLDNLEDLTKFYEQHEGDIWIGFNVRHYDSYMLRFILMGLKNEVLFTLSNEIVNNRKPGAVIVNELNEHNPVFKKTFWGYPLIYFDLKKGISEGLKKLEGMMGDNIKESSIPFDLDRELTEVEKDEVKQYCKNDVIATARVLSYRADSLRQHKWLINNFNLMPSDLRRTDAQLIAIILGAKKKEHKDEFKNLQYPDFVEGEYCEQLKQWFMDPQNQPKNNEKLSTIIKVGDTEITMGWGGCHAAINNYYCEGEIYDIDVASYYPSIMIEYNFLSRNVKDKTIFKDILTQRLAYKKEGNKGANNALKLVVNGTYGASGDINNDLCDKRQMREVCIYGQLMLLDLVTRLNGKCKFININTDGLYIQITNTPIEDLQPILDEWQQRTKMNLEIDKYKKVIQRDVNNYVMVPEEGPEKGKGALMKELSELDYNIPIIRKALKAKLLLNIPIGDTINNCNDLREFQQVAHITDKFDYCMWNDMQLPNRTNRVFASVRESDGGLLKCRPEGKMKFQGTPKHCFIDNGCVLGVIPPEYLDRKYYIEQTEKEYQKFIGGMLK